MLMKKKMKSNDKIIIAAVFSVGLISLLAFLFVKMLLEKKETISLKIDDIEDARGLGYSGQRKVVANSNGEIFVAYRKKYQGKSEIFVAKIVNGKSGWKISGTDSPISKVGMGVDQRVPSIAVDPKNNIHVVWYGSDLAMQTDNRQIKYSKSENSGSSWSKWKNVSIVDGYDGQDYWQEHPHIFASKAGTLFIVWEGKDQDNEHQQIKISKSTDGGETWSDWKNVKPSIENTQSRPTMVQDNKERLHLFAYSSFDSQDGKQQIKHSWSDDEGLNWSEWENVSDSENDSRHVSAAVDKEGNIMVAWRSLGESGKSQIMHRSLSSGIWSEIKAVAPSSGYQFFPSIGVGRDDGVNIIWMESEKAFDLPTENPTEGRVYMAEIEKSSSTESKIKDISKSGLYPNIPETFGKREMPGIYESPRADSTKYDLVLNFVQY